MRIITKDKIRSTKWSGGTTSELYISPVNTSYKDRDFTFRISSASVEITESTFTALPSINREIMILDGTLELNHHGHYTKTLKPFQQDSFTGDWHTTSRGKVTDFNLMTKAPLRGSITHFSCKKDLPIPKINALEHIFIAIYLYTGNLRIKSKNMIHEILAEEMICFHDMQEYIEREILALSESDIVVVTV